MDSGVTDAEARRRYLEYTREMERLLNEIPGLIEMAAEFQVRSRAMQYYVLNSPDPGLNGMTPIHALERIRELIRGYGEQGAT